MIYTHRDMPFRYRPYRIRRVLSEEETNSDLAETARKIVKAMAKNWKSALMGLALGQLLSLLVTSTQFSSSQLQNIGVHTQFSLYFFNYVLLALVYGGIMIYRRQSRKFKSDCYLWLAFADQMAFFFGLHAYKYTSLTSIVLLDCWTIPCVMLLTWFFLKTKYRSQKMVGIVICVAGLVTFIFSNVHSANRSSGINPLKGDLCIILGATFYGVSNVYQECFVKKADHVEVMASLGISSVIITVLPIAIFKRNELISIYSNSPGAIFPTIRFSLAMFLFYSGVPLLLMISGSTMLNLSLLTSNMWAVLIRNVAYPEKVDWMYFLAFAAVTVGLIVYSGGDKMDPDDGETECKHFDMEANFCPPDNIGISNSEVKSTRIDEKGDITIKN